MLEIQLCPFCSNSKTKTVGSEPPRDAQQNPGHLHSNLPLRSQFLDSHYNRQMDPKLRWVSPTIWGFRGDSKKQPLHKFQFLLHGRRVRVIVCVWSHAKLQYFSLKATLRYKPAQRVEMPSSSAVPVMATRGCHTDYFWGQRSCPHVLEVNSTPSKGH